MIRYISLLLSIIAVTLFGCSSQTGPECFPVHGLVSTKGKPLAEAMVTLHPVSGEMAGGQKPLGITKADGTFELTTFKSGDGAPPGEYAISVELRALQTGGEEPTRTGPNTLPAKYAKPATSGLKFTVIAGENQISPIELK